MEKIQNKYDQLTPQSNRSLSGSPRQHSRSRLAQNAANILSKSVDMTGSSLKYNFKNQGIENIAYGDYGMQNTGIIQNKYQNNYNANDDNPLIINYMTPSQSKMNQSSKHMQYAPYNSKFLKLRPSELEHHKNQLLKASHNFLSGYNQLT